MNVLGKLAGVAIALSLALVPQTATAKKKKKAPAKGAKGPAIATADCGLVPAAVGTTWIYKSGHLKLTMLVKDIADGPRGTKVVTLEEQVNGRSTTATWTCGPDGLVASPESFLFSGEPGGMAGGSLKVTARDGVTLAGNLTSGNGWNEKVKIEATRNDASGGTVAHPPAKIEVERVVSVGGTEQLSIEKGTFATQKVTFELRGRALVGEERYELAIKRPATIWLAKGAGIVKLDDAYDRTWELIGFRQLK